MQNNFPKIPIFLSIMFFALSCSAFFYLLMATNTNSKDSALVTAAWQAGVNRHDEIRSRARFLSQIKPERTSLETHFARSSDVVPFLDLLEGLAPRGGAKAKVSSVDILKDDVGLVVTMSASGSFESVYKFLTLLENSPYELEFVGVDIRKQGEPDLSKKGVTISTWEAFLKIKLLSFIQ